MRATSFAALLAALAACAAPAQPPARDHYNPDALHAAAIERIRVGEVEAACILLRRAARLAPHDARIERTLRDLESGVTAVPAPPEPITPPPSSPQPTPPAPSPPASPLAVPAEPPPPWPPR